MTKTRSITLACSIGLLLLSPSPRFNTGVKAQQVQQLQYDNQLLRTADSAWEKQNWEQAVAHYRRLIQQNPNHPDLAEAHYRIGFYLSYTASPDDSIAEYEKVIRLSPGSELAQEAREGIAALKYFQGKYEEAKNLFGEIMRETEDWATFKEAAYRFKQMTSLVALQKLPVRRSALDCGPRALEFACDRMGVKSANAKLKDLYDVTGPGVSLKQLRDAAQKAGVTARGMRIDARQLDKVPTPFIAHLRSHHFWVITSVTRDLIEYLDPDRGQSYLAREIFLKRWRGDALVFGNKRPAGLISQALTDREMTSLSGGHHLHGNDLGTGASVPDTAIHEQRTCNGPGLPHWSVNMANYNLIVQDTDFVYGGRGLSVGLTRTYNADDSIDSVFGRGWTFNYNAHLTLEPNGMVTVNREDGKRDSYSPRGDGSYDPPPRWTRDKLIKNPDGTWRLILKRSRITQHFDAQGRLVRITDRNDNPVTLQYQGERLVSVTDAVGRVTHFKYNPEGRVSEVNDPLERSATFGYDSNGHLVSYVDMAGNHVSYTYDDRSYMTSFTTPAGTTRFRIGTTPQFNDRPYVLKEIIEPGDIVTRFDTGNEIAWMTDPKGTQTFIFNNSSGETTEIEDGLGNKTKYEYGSSGITSVTDAKGVRVRYAYNNEANLIRITDPDSIDIRLTYDDRENVVKVEHEAGRFARFEYDVKNNLVKTLDSRNGTTIITYDVNGQIMRITDPRGNSVALSYDDMGNRVSVATSTSISLYSYDKISRLTGMTDPNNNNFHFQYDGNDRLVAVQSPDGSKTEYTYNCCLLSGISDKVGSIRYDYDARERLIKYTDTFNNIIGYEYDDNNNLTKLTYPDGKSVLYEYDGNNRMIKVIDWLKNSTEYNYDEAGKLISVINSNNTRTGYKYDAKNKLISQVNVQANGTPISVHKYERDQYGSYSRISSAQSMNHRDSSRISTLTYDASNRVVASTNHSFGYDANGNLTKIMGENDAEYGYDYFNRMIRARDGDRETLYQHDASGNRRSTIDEKGLTNYIVNVNNNLPQILAETDGSGNITAYYVYGRGLVSKVDAQGSTKFYHFDSHGNTVAMTNELGGIVNKYSYDAPGNLSRSVEGTENKFKYNGKFGTITENNQLLYKNGIISSAVLHSIRNIGLRIGILHGIYIGSRLAGIAPPLYPGMGPSIHHDRNMNQDCPENERDVQTDGWYYEGRPRIHGGNNTYRGRTICNQGFQCTYGDDGVLVKDPEIAGTFDFISPIPEAYGVTVERHGYFIYYLYGANRVIGHFFVDVLPWIYFGN